MKPKIMGLWACSKHWGDSLAGSEFIVWENFGISADARKGKRIIFAHADFFEYFNRGSAIVIFSEGEKLFINLSGFTFTGDQCGAWNPQEITVEKIKDFWLKTNKGEGARNSILSFALNAALIDWENESETKGEINDQS